MYNRLGVQKIFWGYKGYRKFFLILSSAKKLFQHFCRLEKKVTDFVENLGAITGDTYYIANFSCTPRPQRQKVQDRLGDTYPPISPLPTSDSERLAFTCLPLPVQYASVTVVLFLRPPIAHTSNFFLPIKINQDVDNGAEFADHT